MLHSPPRDLLPTRTRNFSTRRRALTLVEVVVMLVVAVLALLIVITLLPRERETARATLCQDNLRGLGNVLLVYDTVTTHLPPVPAAVVEAPSVPATLIASFGESGWLDARPKNAANPPGAPPTPRLIRALVCPSETRAAGRGFPAPISYRANAGTTSLGDNGPFAFGATTRLADVRDADGAEYTAGFAERLIGTGENQRRLANYMLIPTLIAPEAPACPDDAGGAVEWRGDAGSDWSISAWRTTLYNHALTPNAAPTCISADGATARIGASSHHPGAVYVLMLDGRVRAFRPSVEPKVWKAFATPRHAAGNPLAR